MRKFGRQAAIGATTVALLLAATGSSLAAVRATRYDGGVAAPTLALPAPAATGTGPSVNALDPTTSLPEPEALASFPPVAVDPAAGSAPPGPAASAPPATSASPATPASPSAPSLSPAPAAEAVPSPPAPSTPRPESAVTVPSLPPASGPTPTTSPSRPSSLACPGDGGQGALPRPGGALRAVSFRLPWPGNGPLVLRPQVSAAGGSGQARIAESSVGGLADDGTSLTLPGPQPLDFSYSLVSGNEAARGTVAFIPPGVSVNVPPLQACRDRSFTLFDVKGRSLEGSPLRIVGVVAPHGTVTVDPDGGTAHFKSAAPGPHSVTLLTASDAGVAGEQVNATVIVP